MGTELFKRLHWLLKTQFAFDLRHIVRSLRGLPRFVADWHQFRKTYHGPLRLRPCLHDRYAESGAIGDEYFWQDLYLARKICQANPVLHVDIGSRLDGFVAHVASFRTVEVFDIRPIHTSIAGIVFRQADMMGDTSRWQAYCDSLSCLHALEHFGLGRYGDPLHPHGHAIGLANMAGMLKTGGTLYLSVPIGVERIEFNAHRVFQPHTIVQLAADHALVLQEFSWIESGRTLVLSHDHQTDMARLGQCDYALGIFVFTRQ